MVTPLNRDGIMIVPRIEISWTAWSTLTDTFRKTSLNKVQYSNRAILDCSKIGLANRNSLWRVTVHPCVSYVRQSYVMG